MIAALIAVLAFGVWWLIGLGFLTILRLDSSAPRVALAAPAVGSAVIVLPLFVCSYAGVSMHTAARPVTALLVAAAVVVLCIRRPRVAWIVVPVIGVCLAEVALVGRPLFEFGFHWYANANDDMANYVLSATHLVDHGLLGPVDLAGLAHDRNYTSTLQELHNAGSRPGADITLAALGSVTGRPPYELFMTFILALQLTMVCAAASLAMTSTRRAWAGALAAGLLAVSPLAAYGMLQQLLPQVWGLSLAAVLFAFLLRREVHREPGASVGEMILIGTLAAAVIVVYVELASTLFAVYGLFVLILLVRRDFQIRVVARLWIPTVLLIVVLLNAYLVKEITYVHNQASSGFGGSGGGRGPDIFGFAFVPGALSGLVGLQLLRPDPNAPHYAFSIVTAIVAVVAVVAGSIVAAIRGHATAVIVVTYAALGAALAARGADFGEFKLFLYVQPFAVAAVASWFGRTRPWVAAVVAVPLAALVVAQLSTQQTYVSGSREPVDLRHASNADLLPAFRRFFNDARQPVISVTENPVLAKLEAAGLNGKPLYFISSNIFGSFVAAAQVERGAIGGAIRRDNRVTTGSGWTVRGFDLHDGSINEFSENRRASRVIAARKCVLVLPSGSQLVVNRRTFPDGSKDILRRRCGTVRNFLVYQNSKKGASFYSFFDTRKDITLYQPEADAGFGESTFSGIGRYLLFRVLDPTSAFRVVVTMTQAPLAVQTVPPAAIVGAERKPLTVQGSGSARLFSAPVRPQMIAGEPYIMLDLGRDGRLAATPRAGVQGLYGRSIVVDPRFLTSYLRDISLIGSRTYRQLDRPKTIGSFPTDLDNPNLEYSGIFEDGWIAKSSYATFAGGPRAHLVLRADVLPIPNQHIRLLVDGRTVLTRDVAGGGLSLAVPLEPSTRPRRIELRWRSTQRAGPNDRRLLAAHLSSFGVQ